MSVDSKSSPRRVILVVDDDRNTREGLQRLLQSKYEVRLAEDAARALEQLSDGRVDLMLSDVRMPGMDGLLLMRRSLARHPNLICILLTAYGNVEIAVEAMKEGAYDFLTKPIHLDHLELLLERALRVGDIERQNRMLREELDARFGLENIIGDASSMHAVFDIIRQAAPTQASILIQGASGTGKELVAHAVHRLSPRVRGPFVPVHCAALSASLLESEMFGHERGAFTGANARRKGRFEIADGGTLFLDEISEIEMAIQVKLLRVLEERRFERVGGAEPVEVDIRLIAATNRNLKQMVDAGTFRADLFFRLDVVNIVLPTLAERAGDIPLLCRHFIREISERNDRKISGITAEALEQLMSYSWPGNVRELRNTIEKMVILSRGDRLTVRDVPANIREQTRGASGGARGSARFMEGTLAEMERARIEGALDKHDGNRTRAAGELGISRRTLHRKLLEYRSADPAVTDQ